MHANSDAIKADVSRGAHLIRVFGEPVRQVVTVFMFGIDEQRGDAVTGGEKSTIKLFRGFSRPFWRVDDLGFEVRW